MTLTFGAMGERGNESTKARWDENARARLHESTMGRNREGTKTRKHEDTSERFICVKETLTGPSVSGQV